MAATPEAGREDDFATLPRMDLPGGETGGASLAPGLSGSPVVHLDEESLGRVFGNFMDTAEGPMAKPRGLVDESDRPSAPEPSRHVIKG